MHVGQQVTVNVGYRSFPGKVVRLIKGYAQIEHKDRIDQQIFPLWKIEPIEQQNSLKKHNQKLYASS